MAELSLPFESKYLPLKKFFDIYQQSLEKPEEFWAEQARQFTLEEISGGSPYGASTISAGDGSQMPSENELAMARFQGRHISTIALKLAKK